MRGYSVAHQRFFVDVDLELCRLAGWTELTIVPGAPDLENVVLDARRLNVLSAQVNGVDAEFVHTDLLSNPPRPHVSWEAPQHRLYKDELKPLFRDHHKQQEGGPGELKIKLPSGIKPRKVSTNGEAAESAPKFDPMTVRVTFELDGLRTRADGIHFVGGKHTNIPRSQWHVYTTHTPIGVATSCWLPCVDGWWSQSTWEMEFSVDREIGNDDDDGESGESKMDDADAEDEGEAEDKEIVVVASNVAPAQAMHPTDPRKKVVRFEMFTPVSSQHVGWAAGPFVATPLVSLDTDQQQKTTQTGPTSQHQDKASPNVAMTVYSLGRDSAKMVTHCTKMFVRAMDYFARDFGSYPFDSYSLCFVGQLPYDQVDAAALTLCSQDLLFPPQVIDPLFTHTEPLIRGLAAQWCGVNIVPASVRDLWITEGMAMLMTHFFVRRLMGNNEYRFRMRQYNDRIVREDVQRPPLGDPQLPSPLCPNDLWFLRLKAPMVLYILDRRMTKTDRSLGITRVLSKLFLQSMSGDLVRSQLTTAHFRKMCEKVAHHRLDVFFNEWVVHSGYPIFRVSQRFNKKRMFIEMGIGQVQSRELPVESLSNDTFMEQAVNRLLDQEDDEETTMLRQPPRVFTGPMTIRIHEADGTPYEHVVDLRDTFTKLDIQYNTKYKRLKRAQKFRYRADTPEAVAVGGYSGSGLINCLGDVLMRDIDIDRWQLTDWGENDDESMFNEAFEWLRVDADFEWLGKMFVGQADYMFASQLQQDRDVVAQFDAVQFFASQQASPLYSTMLTRTLMDRRYFYGVRVAAALGLASMAAEHIRYLGKTHLLRVFQELYCFPGSLVPRANDFSDFGSYFVQKAIPRALSMVRDTHGRCPADCARFVLDLIRYNENSGNPYSDSHYVAALIESAVTTLRPLNPSEDPIGGLVGELDDPPVRRFVEAVTAEIDKCQRLDRWLPSWHHIVTTTALAQDEVLIRSGYGHPRMDKLLLATRRDEEDRHVRLTAFQTLLDLGGYRNGAVLSYTLRTVQDDTDPEIRLGVLKCLARMVGDVAVHGQYFAPGDSPHKDDPKIERQRAIARKSVLTAVPLVREALGSIKELGPCLWNALKDPRTSLLERRLLFELCEVLFEPVSRLVVSMKTPPMYRLSMRRRHDYLMVVRFRSVLKKRNHALTAGGSTESRSETSVPEETPTSVKVESGDYSINGTSATPTNTSPQMLGGYDELMSPTTITDPAPAPPSGMPKLKIKLGGF